MKWLLWRVYEFAAILLILVALVWAFSQLGFHPGYDPTNRY